MYLGLFDWVPMFLCVTNLGTIVNVSYFVFVVSDENKCNEVCVRALSELIMFVTNQ